jgi:hypothetical protein
MHFQKCGERTRRVAAQLVGRPGPHRNDASVSRHLFRLCDASSVTALAAGGVTTAKMTVLVRTRCTPAVGAIVSLALLAAGCGGGAPKIAATVSPLPKPSPSRCTTLILRRQQLGRASARSVCRQAANAHWYHWRVTNEGKRFAYAYCSAVAYDGQGRRLWTEPLGPLGIPWSVGLKPGASYSLTWFLPVARDRRLSGAVAHYKPICKTTKTPLS